MVERLTVLSGTFRDSVSLMLASQDAQRIEGVASASVVSGTPLNIEVLGAAGFQLRADADVGPADLVVAVRAASEESASEALASIEEALAGRKDSATTSPTVRPHSIVAANARGRGDLAVISVPGTAAAYECASAIEDGLDVFCFSSGFGLMTERKLKRRALERNLVLMGPDCGTAIVDGVGIGFCNELKHGPVGIVAASGTGAQQVSCLLDSAGVGVSQLIGVGGRDMRSEIGGLMSRQAIKTLAADPDVSCLVVIGKSPDPLVAAEIAEHAIASGKPAVLAFPGSQPTAARPGVEIVDSLESAAARAATICGGSLPAEPEEHRVPSASGSIRGLFCGGTLRDEAVAVVTRSVARTRPPLVLNGPVADCGDRDAFIDFGSEKLTAGRPHPMIDPRLRDEEVERQSADERVAVVLVDIVLGRCAHPDPAASLAPAVERALARRGDSLAIIVSMCGAQGDAQDLVGQTDRLRSAGASVVRSNARAARVAVSAVALTDPGGVGVDLD